MASSPGYPARFSAPRFSAHVGYLFTELSLPERIAAAGRAGFVAVEHPAPMQIPATRMRELLADAGVAFAQMGLAPGDASRGEKGLAALPDARGRFRDGALAGLDYAAEIGCHMVHPMAGVLPQGTTLEALWPAYLDNLHFVAEEAEKRGLTVLIEPIGPGTLPGYAIARTGDALRAITELGGPMCGCSLTCSTATVKGSIRQRSSLPKAVGSPTYTWQTNPAAMSPAPDGSIFGRSGRPWRRDMAGCSDASMSR